MMQSLFFRNPPLAATFSSHRVAGKKVGRLSTVSFRRPNIICRSLTTPDDGNAPRRGGVEIKTSSHEKKEEKNIQEKKIDENFLRPFYGVERFLCRILLGLSGLLVIKSHANEFPFKILPRIMMACVTGLLIYALVSSAEDSLAIWRLPAPVPWYVWFSRLSMVNGLGILLLALAFCFLF